MKENFPNLVEEIDTQVQEAQRVPNKMDPKRLTPRHIIIKMPKVKNNLKSSKRKTNSYLQRSSHKTVTADFSKETLQARRGWKEVFKVMKGKNLHPRLLYPAKLSFRMEGQINCLPDKVKLRSSSSPSPYYMKC